MESSVHTTGLDSQATGKEERVAITIEGTEGEQNLILWNWQIVQHRQK